MTYEEEQWAILQILAKAPKGGLSVNQIVEQNPQLGLSARSVYALIRVLLGKWRVDFANSSTNVYLVISNEGREELAKHLAQKEP